MKRYAIVVGDKTTAGGMVCAGAQTMTNMGRMVSYHGALVHCPACKSTGYVVGVPPYRPWTVMGKQVALENDLCMCKCRPSPRLIASMRNMSMSFEADEFASMGFAPGGTALSASFVNPADAFDRHFRFVNQDGRPVSGITVMLTDTDRSKRAVTTDAAGRTPILSGKEGERIGVNVFAGDGQ